MPISSPTSGKNGTMRCGLNSCDLPSGTAVINCMAAIKPLIDYFIFTGIPATIQKTDVAIAAIC